MRWKNRRASSNIEDRRRGGSGRRRGGKGSLLVTAVVALVAMYMGVDPRVALQLGQNISNQTGAAIDGGTSQPYQASPEEQQLSNFVSVVLADTEDTWNEMFRQFGRPYQEPTLVLFNDAVRSACGQASSAMGPFYCPGDQKVYIDLSFYRDLKQQLNAPGDFAQAYVIAHEVGHHVQNLLGISGKVLQAQQRLSKKEANALSVKLELQADCLAGIWANHTETNKQVLEQGDVEEALGAAGAIGDDRLQKQATGRVVPDSFTHGTSAQRVYWFNKGWKEGDFNSCNTFAA